MSLPRFFVGIGGSLGALLVTLVITLVVAAQFLAPNPRDTRLPGLLNAPPTRIHVLDRRGEWHAPFIHPWQRVSQLEQRYVVDESIRVPLRWFADGRLVQSSSSARAPLLILGADSFGRDVFSRLLFAMRVSIGLALLAAAGAISLGALVGSAAGYAGGGLDDALMRGVEFVLVLPMMYAALALRAALPLVLAPGTVFLLLLLIFTVLGAPFVARGVRGIVRTERGLDYAVAARSLGAGHWRLLTRHLVPAARGFLLVQLTLLVPAFIVAEATFSYVGLGFPEPVVSLGTMLHDASNVRAFADFPWLLSPAVVLFVIVLGLNLLLQREDGSLDRNHARLL